MAHQLDSQRLKKWMADQFTSAGLNDLSIHHAVQSMVSTSLRGVDSHGINLFPHYHRAIISERIKRHPQMKFHQTAAGTGTLDADHAIGHHAGAYAMEHAIALAKDAGMSAVGVKDSTHFGAAAYFGLMAAKQDMIGFAFTNADALVKAHGAKEAFFGTNPICFCAPLESEEPFCLDMATSTISWNKIINYRRANARVPEGLAFDAQGIGTEDANLAKSLSPVGGYKGYGLGMMVDVICSLLVGGLIGKDMLPMYTSPITSRRRISHFFMVLNVEKFIAPTLFRQNLQSMVDRLRSLAPVDPYTPVLVAGDPEKIMEKQRLVTGIPMDEVKFQEFVQVNSTIHDCLLR
jgi:ureidoglycolate dehydrogenase (NAD+)